MFNCIKSFSYKMNISANQVSNALRMKALGNTKPDTPKIAGNFFANKFTIHLSKNHPFGGPDNQSPDFDGTVENSANGSVLTLKMKSLKYLLLPHTAGWQESGIVKRSEELLNPPAVVQETFHHLLFLEENNISVGI